MLSKEKTCHFLHFGEYTAITDGFSTLGRERAFTQSSGVSLNFWSVQLVGEAPLN